MVLTVALLTSAYTVPPPFAPPSLPQAMAYSAFPPSALWREAYLSATGPSLAESTPVQLVQGLKALASLGVRPGWEWMGLWFEASAPLLHTCSTNLCSQVGGVLLSRSLLSVACPHISHPRDNFLLSWHPHVDRSLHPPPPPGCLGCGHHRPSAPLLLDGGAGQSNTGQHEHPAASARGAPHLGNVPHQPRTA